MDIVNGLQVIGYVLLIQRKFDEVHVSAVGDGFAFSPERFAPSIVPNVSHCVPDAAR